MTWIKSVKKYRLILTILIAVVTAQATAQTQFIKYKKYLIPVSPALPCPDEVLNNGKRNVFYMDDIGPLPETDKFNGAFDPNGFQDLAIVIGLNDKVNLLGIGTSNNDIEAFQMAGRVVTKSKESIPVYKQSDIVERIKYLARCSNVTTDKLIVAIGGPWNKVRDAIQQSINENDSIVGRIEVIGIAGENIDGSYSYYDGDTATAWNNVDTLLGSDADTIRAPFFRQPYLIESAAPYQAADLSSWYDTHFKRVLAGVVDNENKDVTVEYSGDNGNTFDYVEHVKENTGSKLKIADFLTVAKIIWPNDPFNEKNFIHPKIEIALGRLRQP